MAVTAKTTRGVARKPGGASRRHALAVPDFQERNDKTRLMESAPFKLRAMPAAGCELLDDSAYYARLGVLAHAGTQLPGGMPGRVNTAA